MCVKSLNPTSHIFSQPLVSWEIFHAFLSSADFLFKNQLFRKILSQEYHQSVEQFGADQAGPSVGPDHGP